MTCHPDCWFCWEEIDQFLQLAGWILLLVHIGIAAWGARWWQRRLQVDRSLMKRPVPPRLFGELNPEALLLATAVLFFLFNQQTFGQNLHQQLLDKIQTCKRNTALQDCQELSRGKKTGEVHSSGTTPLLTATICRIRNHRPLLQRFRPGPDADAHLSAGRE